MKSLLLIFFLLAFRTPALAQDTAKLPEGTIKVELRLYDYTVDQDHPRIEANGKLHLGLIPAYTKDLRQEKIEVLLKAMTQNHDRSNRYLCNYAPHHGIVFRGVDDKILGSVSSCFHCKELRSDTYLRIAEFYSYWDWSGLRALTMTPVS